jgi:hypothetical protein
VFRLDMLSGCAEAISEQLPVHGRENDSCESEVEYPLTPPPSDHSESRPLSPNDLPRNYTPMTKLRIADDISQKLAQDAGPKLIQRNHSRSPYPAENHAPNTDFWLPST